MNLLSQNISWTVVDSSFTFYVYNYLDNLIASILVSGDISYNGNPFSSLVSNFLNSTVNNTNISLNIEDLTYYNQNKNLTMNVNTSYETYNITLDPNQLVLEFYNESTGNPQSTKFEIFDGDQLFANDSADILVVQQTLSQGNIFVRFNQDDFGANWTQFYEYNNDYQTQTTDNLTLLEDADWTIYFNIRSKDNRVIEGAVVRAEFGRGEQGNWTNVSLMGQRLTQADGTTFFRFDSSTYATLTITADGYDAKEVLLTVGDETATDKSTSYTVYLKIVTGKLSNLKNVVPSA